MKTKFRVGIVGCGVISDNHISSLLDLDNVEICAICDIVQSKAKAKLKQYSFSCTTYTDYVTMLDSERLDAVHILTPHYLHTEMTLEALKRDINVFLEKPMCIKSEDIEKLILAEKNSKARVTVSFQTRFNKTVSVAKEIIATDGGVCSAYATVVWNRDNNYYAQGDWRGKIATEGGGVMINQAIHTIDLLRFLIGIPKNIQSICANMTHTLSTDVEDISESIIEFENGITAVLFATTNFKGSDSTNLHIETKNHIIEIRDPDIFVDGRLIDSVTEREYMGKKCYGNSHRTLIAEFYKSLSTGNDIPIPLSDAQYAIRCVLASYKSNGRKINI